MKGLKFKQSEGQHILKNHGLIDTVIQKAKINHTDTLLEIGSGTGSITTKLLSKAKKVIAYETDNKLSKELLSKLSAHPEWRNKLDLVRANFLTQDIPRFDKCISNIPFNISLPVILKLMACDFKCAYVLVQKEFGSRLTAKPGDPDYSRLSVIVQMLAHVSHVMKVSRNSFFPPPGVDTCFMKIEPRVPRPPINVAEFDHLLTVCFSRKNKTLAGNLKSSTLLSKIESMPEYSNSDAGKLVDEVIDKLGMVDVRTSKMSIEDFLRLLLAFKQANIHFV